MPIDWRKIRVPMVGGLDTKTDPKQVQIGRQLELKNGQFDSLGRITKRNGFAVSEYDSTFDDGSSILDSGTIVTREVSSASGGDIVKQRGEVLISAEQASAPSDQQAPKDGWHIYTLAQIDQTWKDQGPFEPLGMDVQTVSRPVTEDDADIMPDMAYTNGYICIVYGSNSNFNAAIVTIVDVTTGAIVLDRHYIYGTVFYDPHNPQVVAVGNSFHIYDVEENAAGALDLNQAIIDTANIPAAPAIWTVLATDVHGDKLMDTTPAEHSGAGETSVIAYKEFATGQIRIRQYNEAGVLQTNALDPLTPINALSCQRVYDATNALWRVIISRQDNGTTDLHYRIFSEDCAPVAADRVLVVLGVGVTVRQITCTHDESWNSIFVIGSSSIRWWFEIENDIAAAAYPGGSPWFYYVMSYFDTFAGGAQTQCRSILNARLWSKAYSYNDRARVWCVYESPEQSTYFLFSAYDDAAGSDALERCDAKLLYQRGTGGRTNHGLARSVQVGTNSWAFPLLRAEWEIVDEQADRVLRSVAYAVVRTPDSGAKIGLKPAQLGPTVTIGMGGQVIDCAGKPADLGFHLYPEPLGATEIAGGIHQAGDEFTYAVTYEYIDTEGQIHRSAPSFLTYEVQNNNYQVQIYAPCLHKGSLSKLIGNGALGLADDSHTIICYYRLCSDGLYHLIESRENHTDAAYRILTDNNTDAALLDNTLLYTTGGVIANIGAPASKTIAADGERMYLVPEEDRGQIWYSKRKADDQGISFSDLFVMRVRTGGQITALHSMDGKLIIFQRDRISFVYGDGPNDLGHGRFADIQPVTSDVGCRDQRSIVMTPKGIMFMTHKGLYLLDRGLQVSYLGAPAQYANQYDFLDGQLIEDQNQVRWLLSSGEILVWDYLVNQWAVTQIYGFAADTFRDANLWAGSYTVLRANGHLYREDRTVYRDFGTQTVPLDISTAWIKVDGLQGWQRVRRAAFLGEWHGPHTLTVEVYYDYDEATVHQTVTFPVTAAEVASIPAQFRFRLDRQKCQAVKLRIVDSEWDGAAAPDWEAYSISGWELEVGIKQGIAKIGMTRSM